MIPLSLLVPVMPPTIIRFPMLFGPALLLEMIPTVISPPLTGPLLRFPFRLILQPFDRTRRLPRVVAVAVPLMVRRSRLLAVVWLSIVPLA